MKRFLGILLIVVLVSSCTFTRFLRYNAPGIGDHAHFAADTLKRSTNPFTFHEKKYLPLPPMELWVDDKYTKDYRYLEDFLIQNKTTAFLVIHNDTIVYENYFNGAYREKPATVFSVSKAITTTLVAKAIEEGYIESVHQSVSDFIPEYAEDDRCHMTINHLLQMTSGLNFEDRSDVLRLGKAYYNTDVNEFVRGIKLKHEPGSVFAYKSIDTQILGICLEAAIDGRAADYLNEKMWKHMGMEYDALMTLDKKGGTARMYGGFAACTRDLAKFGRLFLHKGNWEGQQLIPIEWVEHSMKRLDDQDQYWAYSNGWWLNNYIDTNIEDKQDFFAQGFGGQYIYVNPVEDIIIVRQGKSESKVEWGDYITRLAGVLVNKTTKNFPEILRPELYEGKYQNEDGDVLRLKNVNPFKWQLENTFTKNTDLEVEGPRVLFNKKKQKRVIFELNENQVTGLYYDNFRHIVFYKKL